MTLNINNLGIPCGPSHGNWQKFKINLKILEFVVGVFFLIKLVKNESQIALRLSNKLEDNLVLSDTKTFIQSLNTSSGANKIIVIIIDKLFNLF